jgi:predicted RNase H-like nuclease
MLVAGVDGCPNGWLVVCAEANAVLRLLSVRFAPSFVDVLDRTRQCDRVGIDIPIGLSDDGRRLADVEARAVLRPYRHNSVFPAPVRAVLGVPDYREACSISATVHRDGKKISKQTHAISGKIHEVDRLMSPDLQQRVCEVHPEVCFWALNGNQPLPDPKRSQAGEYERLRLLANVFADDLAKEEVPVPAARDDFYDACAATWTAWRCATGKASCLPDNAPRDSRGLRMEIVY